MYVKVKNNLPSMIINFKKILDKKLYSVCNVRVVCDVALSEIENKEFQKKMFKIYERKKMEN